MKIAVSNIGFRPFEHEEELEALYSMDVAAIEVAPSRVWPNTWDGLAPRDIENYRSTVAGKGIDIVGLHSLLFDHPELGLFGGLQRRTNLLRFFVHLSGICRDLGGYTLIWGGGRMRGDVALEEAKSVAIDFFGELALQIEAHGTCFCLEPLAPEDTDFINSVLEAQEIVHAVNQSSLKVQIDAKALAANGELRTEIFEAVSKDLVHYHANEPGFEVLGSSGIVDHSAAGQCLRTIGYNAYVSLEQKMIDAENPMALIAESVAVMKEAY